MNKFNNMGGILDAQILFVDELQTFAIVNGTAVLRLETGRDWRPLPIVGSGIIPKVELSETDTLYKHSATIRLNRNLITDSDANILRTTNVRGCILKYCDNAGNIRILGTKEHPLFGKLTETPGAKAADLGHYELALSGKSIHPQLSFVLI